MNNLLEITESVKREIAAKKSSSQIKSWCWPPTKAFCTSLNNKKQKTRRGHLRRKQYKTSTEQQNHVGKEMYDDLFPQDQTLEEVEGFYSDLYKACDSDPNYQEIIRALGPLAVKLLTTRRTSVVSKDDWLIAKLFDALRRTRNNTAPGSTSFTGSFYNMFWYVLKILVCKVILQIQKVWVTAIIPKADKDLLHIKNWRPLTLLHTLYKLISSVLAQAWK